MNRNKKPLTRKVNKKPAPKVISFKDYVIQAIEMLNNNINVVKIEQVRLSKRMDDFETWIPVFRKVRDQVIGKPVRQMDESNQVEKL